VNRRIKNSRHNSRTNAAHQIAPIAALNPRSRFFRSTNLQRDFGDPDALEGIVITPLIKETVSRIANGATTGNSQRAWRINGDYGSGKSTCGLVLARVLSPRPCTRRLGSARARLIHALGFNTTPSLWPVLVVGERVPLGPKLLRAVAEVAQQAGSSTESRATSRDKTRLKQIRIRALQAANDPALTIQECVDIIELAANLLATAIVGGGLLIILDELGKFLEYAAAHDSRQDIYLLQVLAEKAARSGQVPIVVVGLVHQGVESYSEGLPPSARREWTKVAGRFEELPFANGTPAVAELIAGALGTDLTKIPLPARKILRSAMRRTISDGWFGRSVNANNLIKIASHLYPLHPCVIPVATAVARRLAQHERTVLSFVLSGEPFSVIEWSRSPRDRAALFNVADLFDYLRALGGIRVDDFSRRAYWPRLVAAVDAVDPGRRDAVTVMKAVAVLNLVEADGFYPTRSAIESAVGHLVENVQPILSNLKRQGLLHDRGSHAGFAAWPNTSVDLGAAIRKAEQVMDVVDPLSIITSSLSSRSVIAKRHYIESGTLRHFQVNYVRTRDLEVLLASAREIGENDGSVWIVLAANENERRLGNEVALRASAARHPDVIIGISAPLEGLADISQQVARWRYILTNTPELAFDSFATAEAQRTLQAAEQQLAERARLAAGLDPGGPVSWYRAGRSIGSGASRLSALVSDACDELFPKAPSVANELVNRRILSSPAAAARMRLIERLFDYSHVALLGLPGSTMPPEKSIYLSVFHAGRIHVPVETEGEFEEAPWHIRKPALSDDPLHFLPTFAFLEDVLSARPSQRVEVSEVFRGLSDAPYGIRGGLLPLVLAVFVMQHEGEIAFFERGTFIRSINGAAFMRLMKDPSQFELQWHPADPLHAVLYSQLSSSLRRIRRFANGDPPKAVVEVVKELCEFAVALPEYTRRSVILPLSAQRVRAALFAARDPIELVFIGLPSCVGVERLTRSTTQTQLREFVARVTESLACLNDAYARLLQRMMLEIQQGLNVTDSGELRARVTERATAAQAGLTDLRLRGFCLRLSDSTLSDERWLESVGSFVIEKPPKNWTDEDEEAFSFELLHLAQRLERLELVRGDQTTSLHDRVIRLISTQSDGKEVAVVARVSEKDEARTSALAAKLNEALGTLDNLSLAAIAEVITAHASRTFVGGTASSRALSVSSDSSLTRD
jgi:hypothetical protein